MREVGVFEAKTHLSALLDDVAAGESVINHEEGESRRASRAGPGTGTTSRGRQPTSPRGS